MEKKVETQTYENYKRPYEYNKELSYICENQDKRLLCSALQIDHVMKAFLPLMVTGEACTAHIRPPAAWCRAHLLSQGQVPAGRLQ